MSYVEVMEDIARGFEIVGVAVITAGGLWGLTIAAAVEGVSDE